MSLKDLDISSSGSKANLSFCECCESVCLHGRPAALAFCSPKRSGFRNYKLCPGIVWKLPLGWMQNGTEECSGYVQPHQDWWRMSWFRIANCSSLNLEDNRSKVCTGLSKGILGAGLHALGSPERRRLLLRVRDSLLPFRTFTAATKWQRTLQTSQHWKMRRPSNLTQLTLNCFSNASHWVTEPGRSLDSVLPGQLSFHHQFISSQ